MSYDLLLDGILGPAEGGEYLETDRHPDPRAIRRQARHSFRRIGQREALADVLPAAPAPGETVHVVSIARYNFWTFVPQMIDWADHAQDLYVSTWTTNRPAVVELLELIDAGRVDRVGVTTGLYFKRRETAVYSELVEGLQARGHRYRAFKNHCKVLLLSAPEKNLWLTCDGSANLTSNPPWEQFNITNDRALFDFHQAWFEEMLT